LEKRSHEDELQKMNEEISSISRAAEERLNELHPDQHREYEVLQEENQHLSQELSESREELDQVNQRLMALEAHVRSDILRTRSQQLLEARKEANEELERLEIEARQCSMSVPEQREILLSKVKTDNADIVAAEKRNSELKLEKERLKNQIQEVTADAQERKDDNDQQKYEILFTKDKEMTQFIDSFDDSRKEEERKMKEKQDSISVLLENISKAVSLQAGVTPDGHLRDMEDELDFKSRQLQNSENTQNRLEAELTKRQGELEKIESLDTKISLELQQVEAKMRQYEEEIETKFDRVGDLRQDGEQRLRLLEDRKRFLESRVSALRQQVGFLKLKNEGRKQELADDQAASNLDAHEQKIRQFGQTLHTLRSFIQQKTAESDFTGEMSSVLNIAGALNKILLETRRVA
jgi:intraflagellar transport protein 74